jgi:hypothetical protein
MGKRPSFSQEPPLSLTLSPRRGRGDSSRAERGASPLSPRGFIAAGRGIGRGAALGTQSPSEPAAKVRDD